MAADVPVPWTTPSSSAGWLKEAAKARPGILAELDVYDDTGSARGSALWVLTRVTAPGATGMTQVGDFVSASDEPFHFWVTEGERTPQGEEFVLCCGPVQECRAHSQRQDVRHVSWLRLLHPEDLRKEVDGWLTSPIVDQHICDWLESRRELGSFVDTRPFSFQSGKVAVRAPVGGRYPYVFGLFGGTLTQSDSSSHSGAEPSYPTGDLLPINVERIDGKAFGFLRTS